MLDFIAYLSALALILSLSVAAWLVSIRQKDVSIVDSLWSLMILLSLLSYLYFAEASGPRTLFLVALLTAWSVRLSVYITLRNHGQGEDRRYQEIRANNQPNFELKSLYIVFLLQGFLAWVICLPVVAAVSGQAAPGPLDYAGAVLFVTGLLFEVVGDFQLSRFRRSASSKGTVLDSGLWRYTRHPNYFGEALLWWGFYLFALSAGAWWTVISPVLMTLLLLKVSGVTLLEKDMAERRPAYLAYTRRTNAFFPGPPGNPPQTLKKISSMEPEAMKSAHRKTVARLGGLAFLLVTFICANPVLGQPAGDLEVADENAWRFTVYLDDKEIGYHHFFVAEYGETRQLRSIASFEYKLMFVRLFHYDHENLETWNGDCLQSVESRTDSNGEAFTVEGRREPGQFSVAGNGGQASLPECVMSFAYWNPAFLRQASLLNTQNGEYLEVEVSEPVFEELEVRGELRPSYRYRLAAGALKLDLWYSTQDEWLALESDVRGGRKLRYELDGVPADDQRLARWDDASAADARPGRIGAGR